MYKDSLDEYTPFHKVNILKSGAKKVHPDSFTLQVIRNKRNEVTEEKKANIREQLAYIDDEFKYFYKIFLDKTCEGQVEINKRKKDYRKKIDITF